MTTINIVTKETIDNEVMTILENAQDVGGKVYASIPIRLLAVDESYQRVEFTSEEKIADLARNFNPKLMDAPRVSAHVEEGKFYLVDGYHRTEAKKRIGDKSITCEILQDMSNDPEERRKQEADIFRNQQIWTEKPSPASLHKANMVCDNNDNIALDSLVKKYGFMYKTNKNRGRCAVNTLSGFTAALRAVRVSGRETLDDIFYVLKKSRWNEESGGLSANAISVLQGIFDYNPVLREHKKKVVKFYKKYSPKMLEVEARSKYKYRSRKVAEELFLEDLLAEVIKIDKGVHEKYHVDTAA